MTAESYTSKPVTITAIRWDGTDERSLEIREWVERTHRAGAVVDTDHIQFLWDYDLGAYKMPTGKVIFAPYGQRCLIVLTLEGEMVAEPGAWIIRGTEGEFYPCIDSVFVRKYRVVAPAGNGSSFVLSRVGLSASGDSFVLEASGGALVVNREDLEEAYRQLDNFLYPNPGCEPRIAEHRE